MTDNLITTPDPNAAPPQTPPITPPPVTTPVQATPPAPPVESGQGDDPKWLEKRLEQARRSSVTEILKALGVETVDELTELATDAKKRREGEKSELQKVQDALAKAQRTATEAEQRFAAVEQQRITDRVSAVIVKVATEGRAQYPQDVVDLIVKEWPDKFKALWKDDTVDEKTVKVLIEDVKKARPTWFQSGGVGSPSNRNGHAAEPHADEKRQAALRQAQNIRSRF